MNRSLLLTALTIAALSGTAAADHHRHGGGNWGRGNGGVRWSAGVTVQSPRVFVQPRVVVQQPRVRVVRRPIYVRAPQIRVHYYDYYQQPTAFAENYPARDGYYWVAGQWTWTGYEWSWQAGHYEPAQQPVYDQGYYDTANFTPYHDGNQGYYDQGYEQSYQQAPCND